MTAEKFEKFLKKKGIEFASVRKQDNKKCVLDLFITHFCVCLSVRFATCLSFFFFFVFYRFAHIDLANPDDLDSVLEMQDIEYKGSTLIFEKGKPMGASKPERTDRDKGMFMFSMSMNVILKYLRV